jgi:hypothetical protein
MGARVRSAVAWYIGYAAMVLTILGSTPTAVQAQCNRGECKCQYGQTPCFCLTEVDYTDYCGSCAYREADFGTIEADISPDPSDPQVPCDWFCGQSEFRQCNNHLWI